MFALLVVIKNKHIVKDSIRNNGRVISQSRKKVVFPNLSLGM